VDASRRSSFGRLKIGCWSGRIRLVWWFALEGGLGWEYVGQPAVSGGLCGGDVDEDKAARMLAVPELWARLVAVLKARRASRAIRPRPWTVTRMGAN
jgi:hypothetical protein